MTLLKRLIAAVVLATYALNVLAIERVTYYHNDATGSPIAATDQNGQILWTETYAPYGERLDKNANGEPAYTGKFEEADFGINYFNARWYDPKLGRFLATDPVRFTEENLQSFNRYAYGNNNPYKFGDPDGKVAGAIVPLLIFVASAAMVSSATYLQSHPAAAKALGPLIGQIGAGGKYGWNVYQAEISQSNETNGSTDDHLSDDALVCRGGECTAKRFEEGTGVTIDENGNLGNVSVNSKNGASLGDLTEGIPNGQVGVTTVGDIRAAGGDVTPSPTGRNPNHATLTGISSRKAQDLFTPTAANPNARKK